MLKINMMNKIIFHSNRMYNKSSDKFHPVPSKKSVPDWYSNASRIEKDNNGNPYLNHLGGEVFSFKACPALIDMFTAGYLYKTPCDLLFYKDQNGDTQVKTEKGFEDFCGSRQAMREFVVPNGYGENHFHWYPNWAPSVPDGYSVLYLNPINRFDLPFITTAGIIDNDKMDTPGLVPFFLQKEFTGIIPAGTPYLQVIPFKRENWEMEIKHYEYSEILKRHQAQADLYRKKEGGQYKKFTWTRKRYE